MTQNQPTFLPSAIFGKVMASQTLEPFFGTPYTDLEGKADEYQEKVSGGQGGKENICRTLSDLEKGRGIH